MYTLKAPFTGYVLDTVNEKLFTLNEIKSKGKLYALKPIAKETYRLTVEGIRSRYTIGSLVDYIEKTYVDKSNFHQLAKPYHKYGIDMTTQKVFKIKKMVEIAPSNGTYKVKGIFGINIDGSLKSKVANHDFEYLSYFACN